VDGKTLPRCDAWLWARVGVSTSPPRALQPVESDVAAQPGRLTGPTRPRPGEGRPVAPGGGRLGPHRAPAPQELPAGGACQPRPSPGPTPPGRARRLHRAHAHAGAPRPQRRGSGRQGDSVCSMTAVRHSPCMQSSVGAIQTFLKSVGRCHRECDPLFGPEHVRRIQAALVASNCGG